MTTIHRATLADAEDVAAVFSAAFASMRFVPKIHSDDEDRDFIRGLIATKEMWFALHDNRVIGLACYDNGWLEQLYVHPLHHNKGVGTRLFKHVARHHPEGFRLWTFQANTGACRFYERHGCKLVKLTDGRDNEEKTPDALYAFNPCPAGTG